MKGLPIGAPLRDGLVGAHFVEAVIGHEEPAEEPLDRQIVKGRNSGPARVALDHMKISETSTRQCRGDVVEQALRIAVSDVVLAILRRDAQAGALGANRSGHRVDDLEQEPHTVLNAASISVRALVGTVAQELIDQISVRAMYLDTVEAGRKRVPRSLRILRDDAGDLGCLKRAWRGDLLDGGEEIPRGLSGEVLHEAILLRREDVNGTTPPISGGVIQRKNS